MKTITLPLMSTLGLMLLAGSQSPGATINVGTHELLPNTAGQIIQIFASGTELVTGLDAYIQVGDGGPILGGSSLGPEIESLDLVTGTFLGGVPNDGQFNIDQYENYVFSTITTSLEDAGPPAVYYTATPGVDGLLLSMSIDTSGFTSGSWDLMLANVGGVIDTALIDEDGFPIFLDITNGTITIQAIPEPSMLPLWALVPMLGGVYFWRNRRSRRREEPTSVAA